MIDVPALIDEAKAKRIKIHPQHVNRASAIGHPCLRYLVYSRTHWQEKRPHDVGLQRVFDLGNVFEQVVLNDMREAGLTIEEQQVTFHEPRYQLSGHIDGKLPLNGRKYPVEIKSMSPFAWQSIGGLADLQHSKRHYIRGYYDQLQTYLFMHNEELGFLFLVNKATGELKQIEVALDYQYMEGILRKCEVINEHVAAGTLPDPIPWDDSVCGQCAFLDICQPARDYGAGVEIVNDDELEAMLARRDDLLSAYRQYQEVDKAVKAGLKGKELAIIGLWEIKGKFVKRKGYTVEPSEYWDCRIRKLANESKN